MSKPLSSFEETNPNILLRTIALLYGVASYAVFLAVFSYFVGFVGNLPLPTTIDNSRISPLAPSIAIDLALVLLFAVQHSSMARPSFKRWCTRFLPVSIERSTYVLFSSLALLLLFWQWRAIPNRIWAVDDPLFVGMISGLFWIGWALVLVSTFITGHFQFFGLSQVFSQVLNWKLPAPVFKTVHFYKYVRHPLYLGLLLAFWAAPVMTAGHLVFALATTGYILAGIQLEERDLITTFGEEYRRYRQRVGMLIPRVRRELRREAQLSRNSSFRN
jgi:protein-S-isoprenylcysteine O-methyltransferase Ste14